MENLSSVAAAADVPTKAYVDNVVHIGGTQPTGSEMWLDTAAPDPAEELLERLALLEARVEELERRS